MATPKPFQIAVPDELLSFINQRVSTARLPPGFDFPPADEWKYGVPPKTIQTLQDYWTQKYNWRRVEKRINSALKMYTLPISEAGEELDIHFVWHQSDREGAIPILIQHGWPGNFLEVEKIITDLTSPASPTAQAYHVVAPSLPGFVFSSFPRNPNFNLRNMASINHKLMLSLGYDTYMAQGGDLGSIVVRLMGLDYPAHCAAVHVNMVVAGLPSIWRNPLQLLYLILWAPFQSSTSLFGRMLWWQHEESGYLEIQGTKPLTVSYGLVDSPVGMMAWIRDKLEHLVDDDFEWEDEEVITWAMLYLIPGTAGHATIYTNVKGEKVNALKSEVSRPLPSEVDFGASVFPKDVCYVPRWWAGACVAKNIVFWREHEKGGHFAALEKPVELVQDIREFTQLLYPDRKRMLVASGKLKK